MGNLRHLIRRDSQCPWLDFVQRVRLGLAGALIILIIAGAVRWIMN